MDAELIELDGAETLVRLFAGLKQRGCKKVLAFCTSRAECEEWAYRLRPDSPFGDRVYVHHASLDARVRRAVEYHFAHAEAALCFATSTLELGIDIGDVDLVVLIGAPGNLSAFLQRIGRGNRRTARTAVVCCARHALERALFQVFIRTAESGGEIASEPYLFRPSVVVQQLCSYIKQTRLGEIVPDVEDHDDFYVMMKGAIPAGPLEFTADKVVSHLRGRWRRMESWFDLGRFQRELPLDVRRASVIAAFDVAGFVRAFNGRRLAEVKPETLPNTA